MNDPMKVAIELMREASNILSEIRSQNAPPSMRYPIMDELDGCAAMLEALTSAPKVEEREEWRCFHCGEVFTDSEQAALHFGQTQFSKPACQFDVASLRETEALIRRH